MEAPLVTSLKSREEGAKVRDLEVGRGFRMVSVVDGLAEMLVKSLLGSV